MQTQSKRKPMTDASNHGSLLRVSKKNHRKNPNLDGIYTNEEEKLTQNTQSQSIEKKINQNEKMNIESEGESGDDIDIDILNKNSKQINSSNQDLIADVAHKLILKNKINAKNAFDIPMLKINEMTDFHKLEGDRSWKKLSSALEAGARIYGFRVDSVHNETYKILGGLTRTDLEDKKINEESKENEEADEGFHRKIQRNTGLSNGESTLERHIHNINVDKYDLEFDVDPMFSKTSAKFDEAGCKSLLLNTLAVNEKIVVQLGFDCKESLIEEEKKTEKRYNGKEDIFKVKEQNYTELCPQLHRFKEENKRDAINIFNLSRFSDPKTQTISELKNDETDQVLFDCPDLMDDINRFFENKDQSESNFNGEEVQNINNTFNEDNFDLNLNLNDENTNTMPFSHNIDSKVTFNLSTLQDKFSCLGFGKGFSFNDQINSNWMGPEAWKLTNKQGKGTIKTEHKERTKKKLEETDFINFDLTQKEEISEIFPNSKKQPIKLDEKIELTPFRHFYLLPIDLHINVNRLVNLFTRRVTTSDYESEYQFNTANENNDINDGDDIEFGANNDPMTQEINNNNNANNQIHNRRGVPIKELKEKIWENLKNHPAIENHKNNENETLLFSDIMKFLIDILGENRVKQVSIQTLFLTVLHLANENCLRLVQEDNFKSNFKIEKDNYLNLLNKSYEKS